MTWIIQLLSASIREIRGRENRLQRKPSDQDLAGANRSYREQKSENRLSAFSCSRFPLAHPTAHFSPVFAPMCTSVHLRAPLCGKTKKSEMLHKPHRTAQRDSLASTCTYLHQVASTWRKKIARGHNWELGAWDLFGGWNLELGTSAEFPQPPMRQPLRSCWIG